MAASLRVKYFNSCLLAILLFGFFKRLREIPGESPMEETLISLIGDTLNCNDNLSFSDRGVKRHIQRFLSPKQIVLRTSDCNLYFMIISTFAFKRITPKELEFPLAFSHLAHKEPGVLEMYLAVHFRPTDSHCIHVDSKASAQSRQAFEQLIHCYQVKFPNSFIFSVSDPMSVYRGHHSILSAEMLCLKELKYRRSDKFKMYMNLAASELPLVSLKYLRHRLKSAGGNIVDVGFSRHYWRQREKQVINKRTSELKTIKLPNLTFHPLCNFTVMKGYKSVALTRSFANSLFEKRSLLAYRLWMDDRVTHNNEHFFNTMATIQTERAKNGSWILRQRFDLQHPNKSEKCYKEAVWPHLQNCVPTGYRCDFDLTKSPLMNNKEEPKVGGNWMRKVCLRKTLWKDQTCHGKISKWICILGVEDLPKMWQGGDCCMMANKFSVRTDPAAIICQVKRVRKLTDKTIENKARE